MKKLTSMILAAVMLLGMLMVCTGCADPNMTFTLQVEVEEKIYVAGDTLTAQVFLTATKDIADAVVQLTPTVGDGLAEPVFTPTAESIALPAGSKVEVGTITAKVTAEEKTASAVSVADISVKAPGANYKKPELFAMTGAEPVLGHFHDLENGKAWKAWTSTTTLPEAGDDQYNYYLTDDVVLEDTPSLTKSVDMGLCLNGHSVTVESKNNVYRIGTTSNLYVCDCAEEKGVVHVGEDVGGAFLITSDDTTLTLKDIVIDGTNVQKAMLEFGAIYTFGNNIQVTLDGTTIQNCTAQNGSAIYAKGTAEMPAIVNITNGSVITGNTILSGNKDGSAAVLGYHAVVNVIDSSVTNNTSSSICGVGISFASSGTLNLHNAEITGNHSTYEDLTNLQVGAVYIHNGKRSVNISGNTIIRDNTRCDGQEANIYLQRTVRLSDPDKYPNPLQIKLGTLEQDADIGICLGLGYETEQFKTDINKIPMLSLMANADGTNWQNQWITLDNTNEQVVYDYHTQEFSLTEVE